MNCGATGIEVRIGGKLRAQRVKSVTYRDGYLLKVGDPKRYYLDIAIRHCELKQGIIGCKVTIMKPYDDKGVRGPNVYLPDKITILDPK
jgi:ribosomal protein S3